MIRVVLPAVALVFSMSAFAEDAKVLKPADLAVETSKWDGRVIETTLSCFYADKDEFRCLDFSGGSPVRIDFREFDTEGQKYLEDNCDEIEKADTPRCRVTLRFTYAGHGRMPTGGLIDHITTIQPENYVGIIVKHPK